MSSISDPPPNPPPPPLKKVVKKKPALAKLPPSSFSFANASIEMILEDLSTRFILNLPDSELMSVERVCFQVEQAHWYYEDFVRLENSSHPSMPLRNFSAKLFAACPLLQRWSHRHEEAFAEFLKYKTSVPVCGAILLNDSWDKCVLVKGWKSSAPWSFPRGKINQNEPLHECASREVLEETGFDCKSRLLEDQFITVHSKDSHTVTLFVIPNVPEDFPFNTRTRKEISKIDWFQLSHLPGWGVDVDDANWGTQRNGGTSTSSTSRPIKTWNISAFLAQLKRRLREFQIAFAPANQVSSDSPSLAVVSAKGHHTPRKANARSTRHQQTPSYSDTHPKTRTQTHVSVTSHGHDGRDGANVTVHVDTTTSGNETDDQSAATGLSTNHESSSQSSADPVTPSSSAVDALFSRSNLLLPAQIPLVPGSVNSKEPGSKATRRGMGRATQSHPATETGAPKVEESLEDQSHMNTLMQSLFKSSLSVSPNTSGETEVPSSSGLPTPAESPVLLKPASSPLSPTKSNGTEPRSSRRSRTTTATTVTVTSSTDKDGNPSTPESAPVRSLFDFVSPFDAFEPPPPLPALPTPSNTDESNNVSDLNGGSSDEEDQLPSASASALAPQPVETEPSSSAVNEAEVPKTLKPRASYDWCNSPSSSPCYGLHVPSTLDAPAPGIIRSLSRNAFVEDDVTSSPDIIFATATSSRRKESESSSSAAPPSSVSSAAMSRQPSIMLTPSDRHLALLQSTADEADRSSQQSQDSSREQSRSASMLTTPKSSTPLELNMMVHGSGSDMGQAAENMVNGVVTTPMASSTAAIQPQVSPFMNGNLHSVPGFGLNGSGSPFSHFVPPQTQQHSLLHQHTPHLHHIPPNSYLPQQPPPLPPTMVSPNVPPNMFSPPNGFAMNPNQAFQGGLSYGGPAMAPGFGQSPAMAPLPPHSRSISGSYSPNVPGLAAMRGHPAPESSAQHAPAFGMNGRADLAAYPYNHVSAQRPISSMSSVSASSASSAARLRTPYVAPAQPPNPNSFAVQQKSPSDRNALLSMITKNNKPTSPINARSNTAGASSPLAVLLGKASPGPNNVRRVPSAGKPAIPVDDGFGFGAGNMMVPANVQFRTMLKKTSATGK